jgi:hypothetical protein
MHMVGGMVWGLAKGGGRAHARTRVHKILIGVILRSVKRRGAWKKYDYILFLPCSLKTRFTSLEIHRHAGRKNRAARLLDNSRRPN